MNTRPHPRFKWPRSKCRCCGQNGAVSTGEHDGSWAMICIECGNYWMTP